VNAAQASLITPARMIALGGAALMEGFALIGFETYADPQPDAVEKLLHELLRSQKPALLVIEHNLTQNPGRNLLRAQREGGRIVITEIPELRLSESYHSRVETLVRDILGSSALESKE
jgi:vacuolar-type H+-ATPase subunit F/Vma7